MNGVPAIITHHIFGEDAAALVPEGILASQEDLLAFLLGNQGPDPYFARVRTTPKVARSCHAFAAAMHESHMCDALLALRDAVTHLREEDKSCGRAFALGMASHYVLDRMTHPLVYAQQEGIIAADPELAAARGEIHALIEADIDVWMLWEKRQSTILDISSASVLASTERINRVAGALLSQVAWQVFGADVGAAEYGHAIGDYRLFYQLIDPPAHTAPRMFARIERLARPHSRLRAQAHRTFHAGDDCPFANLDHHRWRDPATGEASIASFADLFHDALIAWPEFSCRFAAGDQRRLADMIANINYYGQPL